MDFLPSTFTPFLRRFTDERARDTSDTKALYARVRKMHEASFWSGEDGLDAIVALVAKRYDKPPPDAMAPAFEQLVRDMLKRERTIFALPEPDFRHLTLKEATDFRRFLRAKEYFHAHENEIVTRFVGCIGAALRAFVNQLHSVPEASPFGVPLITTLAEPNIALQKTINDLFDPYYQEAGLFTETVHQIYRNACEASGIADPSRTTKRILGPYDADLPPQEAVEAFFAGTPYVNLFLAPVPLRFTTEDRMSHMHILGGSGAGKTTLLQNLILHDLHQPDPPSLVIVDSQGDLINKLSRLALFDPEGGRLTDRFVLITPKDVKHPPAINIFDVNQERLQKYDEAAKEQVVAGVIETFDYLFSGLLGADLTAKQGVFFRFVARLMLALPETMGRTATILDILALMDDPKPYAGAIASLPPIQRQFFERDFPSKTFAQTREQIRYRLNAILENPTLARLFTSPKTKLDFFAALNRGSIILIDTAKDFLKGASGQFGRLMISLVLQAVLERAAIPERERKPTFLIVDEAADYFDSNIDDFLTAARKYKCGCVFAHQFLDQATSSLRASLAANTAMKLAGGVSTGDARAMAPDMRTTADFILGQPRLHFAAYFRGATQSAVSIPVPAALLERQARMSDDVYQELQALNRMRVSGPQPENGDTFTFVETPGSTSSEPLRHWEFRPRDDPPDDPAAPAKEW